MYDEYGNYIGDDFGSGTGVADPNITDNGDGSYTDSSGDIYDYSTGEFLGTLNSDGTWTDINGQDWTGDNRPITDGYIDNGDGTYTSVYTGETVQGGGTLGDGTPAPETGIGGGNVNYDPDEFGDVYTVNGQWVGNIYGLSDPGNTTPTPGVRGPGNQPGGAYSAGGPLAGGSSSSGSNSTADLIRQLQQMLAAARSSNAPTSQQAAISAALANAQKSAGMSTGTQIAIAGAALLALYAFSQRRRAA